MQIGLTPTFEKSLSRLTPREQALVKQVPTDFMLNPNKPGHRLHKLHFREPRFVSISVSMDLRIIVLKEGPFFHFCYVGHHEQAYRWAERRQIEVHPTTGAAQIVEFEEVIREEVKVVKRTVEAPSLFADEDDGYLLALGVPNSWLATVKQLDEAGLYEVLDRLPEEAAEALVELYDGQRPEPAPALHADEAVAADPFEHPDSRRRFWVAADENALRRALNAPWDRWVVFLHPSQREAVERNFRGPARVTGGAGTGKTIVALHRAVYLAELSENARVLLTTYSRPLVRHLEAGLDRLAGPTGDVRRRIRVEHLHRFAYDIAKERPGFAFSPVRPKELDAFFDQAIRENSEVEVSKEFLRAEFDAVVDYWGVKEWKDYREIQRTGRGSALSRAAREVLWPVFDSVLIQMRIAGKMTFSELADAAREEIEVRSDRPFRYVVADEAQDFGPRELRFLMALASPSARSHLFAGDVGQRIYRYPFSWLKAGVDIRGRAVRLSINYRTTHQIKAFADRALGAIEPGEADNQENRSTHSLLSGPEPLIAGFADGDAEAASLTTWFEELVAEGFAPSEMAVFGRTRRILEDRAVPAIEAANLLARALSDDGPDVEHDAVSVGTLHAAKGLEFRAVALVGCSSDVLPHPSALAAADDADGEAIARARERQLFYVGCTRAREVLRVSFAGEPCSFLEGLGGVV